jgi:hypothetical protein
MPGWPDEMAKGYVPYHQLTIEDFPVNDRVHVDSGFWIKPFIHPRYQFYLHGGGLVYAYVSDGLFSPAWIRMRRRAEVVYTT